MPAKSQAQRAYLYHEFGPKWVAKHHFDNKGKLPQHSPSKEVRQKLGMSQSHLRQHHKSWKGE